MAQAHSYSWAVDWIVANDAPGDDDLPDDLAGYISVLLVADIYDKDPLEVANTVYMRRGAARQRVAR